MAITHHLDRSVVHRAWDNSLLPRLREAEARLAGRNDRAALVAGLRDAEAMYRAMGAPDPADRLVAELGAMRVDVTRDAMTAPAR